MANTEVDIRSLVSNPSPLLFSDVTLSSAPFFSEPVSLSICKMEKLPLFVKAKAKM